MEEFNRGNFCEDSNFLCVKEILSSQFDIKPENIKKTSLIYHDLGLTGDDAVEFILSVSKKFDINFEKSNFEFRKHFDEEFYYFFRRIGNFLLGNYFFPLEPLSIADLLNIIERCKCPHE